MPDSVSVVILSHRPALLPQAVASVLRQTVPCELIVKHQREGYPGKFAEGVRAATGDWLVPLCDDDLLAPTYVARCVEFADDGDIVFTDRRMWWAGRAHWRNWRSWFRRTPALGHRHRMFGTQVAEWITREGKATRVDIDPKSFVFGSPLPMTCMIRRSLWESLGGYDDTIPHADTEFWYRAVKAGARVVYIPEPLFLYRFHDANLSVVSSSNGRAALAFHRKHFPEFGFAFTARNDDSNENDLTIVPEAERDEYARRHGWKLA